MEETMNSQEILDNVEYSEEEQADLNVTKILRRLG